MKAALEGPTPLMAVSPWQLDFRLIGPLLTTNRPPISGHQQMQGLVPETSEFELLAGKVWSGTSQACRVLMPPEKLQEVLWQQFFSDSTRWWDIRRSKPTPWHSDFGHQSKVTLWLEENQQSAWVDSQLATWDSGLKTPPEFVSTLVEGEGYIRRLEALEGHLDVAMCRKLCEVGRITDVVHALELLVQRGCHVPNNLFYLVLKRCIAHKDLILGRHIHSLIVKSGYNGDTFLATHLITLYASHGRLNEAMRVFIELLTPDSYNWATIIFAHARNGEAPQAIQLYRQMRESTVQATNRIFVAVLKACAIKGDLVAGKLVHSHILASLEPADIFVQTGLIDMYAKCGRLKDARMVFDRLIERNVVTWTAMIAGYTQEMMGQEALDLYKSMKEEGLTPPDAVTFVCLLQACAIVGVRALHEGKQLHAQIEDRGFQAGVILGGSLVNMYAKCGSLEDARRVFDSLEHRNVVTWNAMLSGYSQRGLGDETLSLYNKMQQNGVPLPDSVTFVSLLQACASIGVRALHQGRQLHSQIEEQGLQDDVVLGGSVVTMYAKCGSLNDARRMFDSLPVKNEVAWTAMIAGYTQQTMGEEALALYNSMQQEGLTPPDSVTFVCLLQACATVGVRALHQGEQLHAQIKERGYQTDLVIGGSLVNMYTKCGSLEDARTTFDRMQDRNVVAWNAMIAGYVQQGSGDQALSLYSSMQEEGIISPDSFTLACLLQACANIGAGALHQGKQLDAHIQERGLEDDVVLCSSLVKMYAECGSFKDACKVFDKVLARDVVIWNVMLAAYVQLGMGQTALSHYNYMRQEGITPNSATFVCLLQACGSLGVGALHQGKQLHAQIKGQGLDNDVVVGTCLIEMYARCGGIEDAFRVFDRLPDRNVVTWTAMIAGYAQQGMGQEAISLYSSMEQEGITPPDSVTFVCLLQACAMAAVLPRGQRLHAQIRERGLQDDAVVGGSLVNMYAKCGSLEDARSLFDRLPDKNVVTWNAMFVGYVQQEMGQDALTLYKTMQQEALTSPDSVTFVCLLQACAVVAALPLGNQLHGEIEERGLQADLAVGAALVNMYAKCGSMSDSQEVFDSLPQKTIEAWNALTGGYTRQGDSEVVFDLLRMMSLEGMQPDGMTFLSVLTVCSHGGLVDSGRMYFEAMRTEYGISPTIEHYTCMMDLLGRAGHLAEALGMAKTMPLPPTRAVWLALLGACRKWNNIEMGQQAFEFAVTLDAKDAAPYVLMYNIYAGAQMWEEAKEMQARRKKLAVWKKPGQSWWTDGSGVVHTFIAGDKRHPEGEGIYARLKQLVPELKKEGYVPHLQSSLRDIPDDEKEAELCGHSEKLAIAYALNKTPDGTTIRIVKNLRVCVDCHTATAYISKVEKRTIICRDASRFHVYSEGKCSCGDYW